MKCFYCSNKATTRDHVIPLSKGGADDESNIVPACKRCNTLKAQHPLQQFLGTLKNLLKKEQKSNQPKLFK